MIIGLAKEIKNQEYRVGLTPHSAGEYVAHGHRVLVERNAGTGTGFPDDEYRRCGCEIVADRRKLFDDAEMIVKVKEPLAEEYELLHEGQILFTYLHLAADRELAEALLARKVTGVAYETVVEADGSLPLLAPMSQIAGRLSVQEGAKYLEKPFGGRGLLLGGVPGTKHGKVFVLGGGVAGTNACRIAVGMGADTTVLDISPKRLEHLESLFGNSIKTLYSNPENIDFAIREADLVIGSVLVPGASTPRLVRSGDLKKMKPGAVLVDIAIDQGGCFETSKPTTHTDPIFAIDGIVHYCVANMPGAVSLTSTLALTSVTNRYGLQLADRGVEPALADSAPLRSGLNCMDGYLTNRAVAESLGMKYIIA